MVSLQEVSPGNFGIIATKDYEGGEEILRESPFATCGSNGMLELRMLRGDRTMAKYKKKIGRFARKYGHLEGAARYPPEAKMMMDEATEYATSYLYWQSSNDQQEKWFALHDCHHRCPLDTTVCVFGLESEQGRRLNGRVGRVSCTEQSIGRVGVQFSDPPSEKSIAIKNLKTPGGVWRSNAIGDAGLFETLCRMNHSCNPNVAVLRANNRTHDSDSDSDLDSDQRTHEQVAIATRHIKMGEQLLVDYTNMSTCTVEDEEELAVTQRREKLLMKYDFECQCERCMAELAGYEW